MLDMPLSQTGAIVSMATANDEDHPASNVIDGHDNTFWMTTGLYPQSLIISFPQTVEIRSVKLSGSGMKHLIVEKCSKSTPTDFEIVSEKNLRNEEDRLQTCDMKISHGIDAKHVKIIVNEGYNSFIAIQHIKLDIQKNNRSEY